MKKSNRLLIIMFIFLCFLCILYGNSALATNVPVRKNLNLDNEIGTTEIWNQSAEKDNIYCIDPGTSFTGGQYKVIGKYEIKGNEIIASYYEINEKGEVTNKKVENKEIIDTDTKKQLFARAYILTEYDPNEQNRLDNTFNYIDNAYYTKYGKHLVDTSERITKNGIYNVLSYKQEALWMFLSHGFWLDKDTLEFSWKLDNNDENSRGWFGIGYNTEDGDYKFLRPK